MDYSNNVLVQPQYSSITKFDGGGDMLTVKRMRNGESLTGTMKF